MQTKKAMPTPRAVYIARKLREQLTKPDNAKGAIDAVQRERTRSRNKEAQALVDFCAKVAFAVPSPGQIMKSPRHIGSFSGKATENFLKAPGSTTAAVTNPRLSLRNAMTKTMRA